MKHKKRNEFTFYDLLMLISGFFVSVLLFFDKHEDLSDGTYYALIAFFIGLFIFGLLNAGNKSNNKES